MRERLPQVAQTLISAEGDAGAAVHGLWDEGL